MVHALAAAGFHNLSVTDVKRMLPALDSQEQDYSTEIGQQVITEVKLELVCRNEACVTEAVRLIRKYGRTGQPESGWIYISEISAAWPID